jgi:regulator of protease activity HflC (stomatin/prohibitin superfamily)
MTTVPPPSPVPAFSPQWRSRLDSAYRLAVVVLAVIVAAGALLAVSQAALYKIHPFERGLHLRGGRFLAVDQPGWHVQIPYVDTVLIVKVNERLGYVERISAVTADNLQMVVSLQYTYRVNDPERFALEVDDPERILFELVQGKLRDVVNARTMTDMMNDRTTFNSVMMDELRAREADYGVEFVTVQIQSAEPPADVVSAIEDRMVATQRQSQAEAEAAQQRVLADAEFYAAQKRADAEAYQITQRATAQQASIRLLIGELSQHPEIADKYLDYLMTQELKYNSKWVLGEGGAPILDLRPDGETTTDTTPVP